MSWDELPDESDEESHEEDGGDDTEESLGKPLPPDDRLWRHPSELGAAVTARLAETPRRKFAAVGGLSALGGAAIVAGLWLLFGASGNGSVEASPGVERVVLQQVAAAPKTVEADDWAMAVSEQTAPAVPIVEAVHEDGLIVGSGVMFRSDGYLLTTAELVTNSKAIDVVLPDGRRFEGALLGADRVTDLAVVTIEAMDLPTAPLDIFRPLRVGQYAVTLSGRGPVTPGPIGDRPLGTITALDVKVSLGSGRSYYGVIQLDHPVTDEADGGAVVDDTGAVIGIAVDMGTENAGHAVPIGYARNVAQDIIVTGRAQHSWLGIEGVDLSADDANELGVVGGPEIKRVITGGPAESAGLRVDDVILSVQGSPVRSMSELVLELRKHPSGKSVEVRYLRDGEREVTVAVLAQRP